MRFATWFSCVFVGFAAAGCLSSSSRKSSIGPSTAQTQPAGFGIPLPYGSAQNSASAEVPQKTDSKLNHEGKIPEMVVTGTIGKDVPEVPLDATGSRDILGPQDIRESGAREGNELMKLLPGVSTRPYNGGEAGAPSFSMRGLPDDGLTEYILLQVDGVPASTLAYGWTAMSFLPVTIERLHAIDIVRGGHAVRYSPNTVGGVLNLITKPIPEEKTIEAMTTFGSNGFVSNFLSYGDKKDEFGYLFTVVDKKGQGYREDGEFDLQDLSLKMRFDPEGDKLIGDFSWIETAVSYMSDEHKAPGGLTPTQYDADEFANARPLNYFRGWRVVADAVAHRDFEDGSWVEPFFYFSETARRFQRQEPLFGSPVTDIRNWEDESLFGAVGIRGGRKVQMMGTEHNLYYGFRYHQESLPTYDIQSTKVATSVVSQITDASYSLSTFSAHLDDTFQILPGWTVVPGVRAEWIYSKGENDINAADFQDRWFELMPAIGTSFVLTDHWALYGNWQKSFRSPQVWGYDFTNTVNDLDLEKGKSFEVGTRVKDLGGVTGSFAVWQVDFDDVGVFYSGFYENLGRILSRGFDAKVEVDLDEALCDSLEGLSVNASWTHQDSELKEGPNDGNRVPYAWRNKGAFGVRYRTPSEWIFRVGGTYVGDTFSDEAMTATENANGNLGPNRSALFWDARAERDIPLSERADAFVALGVTNLMDEERFVHSRGGFFGGGRVAYPPQQAYVTIGFNFRF